MIYRIGKKKGESWTSSSRVEIQMWGIKKESGGGKECRQALTHWWPKEIRICGQDNWFSYGSQPMVLEASRIVLQSLWKKKDCLWSLPACFPTNHHMGQRMNYPQPATNQESIGENLYLGPGSKRWPGSKGEGPEKFLQILYFPVSLGLAALVGCWMHSICGCHKLYVLSHRFHTWHSWTLSIWTETGLAQ